MLGPVDKDDSLNRTFQLWKHCFKTEKHPFLSKPAPIWHLAWSGPICHITLPQKCIGAGQSTIHLFLEGDLYLIHRDSSGNESFDSGIRTTNVRPRPLEEVTVVSPLCWWMILRVMKRRNPVPRLLLEEKKSCRTKTGLSTY